MQEQCARYKRYKRVYINIGVHLHYAEPAGRHVPCGVAYPAAEYAEERYAEELLRVRKLIKRHIQLPRKACKRQSGQYCEKGHSAHKEKARKPVYIARHHHGVQRPEYRGGYGQHITQRIEFQHHCPVEHHQRHAHKGDERAVHRIPPEPVPFCKEMRQHGSPYGRRGYEYAYV